MTLISWNGGPIFRSGAVGTEQACCCGCNVNAFYQWGGENSGALGPFLTIYPSSPHCVKIVFATSSFSVTLRIRARNSSNGQTQTLFDSTSESQEFCFFKGSGFDQISIQVFNAAGSPGSLTLTCDDCDCNEFP